MAEKSKRVAICYITDENDNILMGMRNDCSLYTIPCGHVENGEDPYEGAARELKEETGLDAIDIKMIGCKIEPKKNIMLYLFKVKIDPSQTIDTTRDPDQECDMWFFMDPNDVKEELHVPVEENIALKYWIEN